MALPCFPVIVTGSWLRMIRLTRPNRLARARLMERKGRPAGAARVAEAARTDAPVLIQQRLNEVPPTKPWGTWLTILLAVLVVGGFIYGFSQGTDIGLAVGVMGIILVLILPLPPMLLDGLLAVSIVFSVLILMTALFIQTPLEFSSFPTVLLIAAMMRLALNLATTRLILADGHNGTDAAGHVIEAFGHFVMRGNFIIGVVVFAILILVNFIVITKGSGRIAEVAARFNLDAMPGKQMAIDADLSSGLIDEDTARKRRETLESESAFFGNMDGASKFVRGDAIAGLLITFINIIAGMIIGTMQEGMSFQEAANNYTLLTVGDGLVTQIPALIVSTAAGLLVSKAGVTGSADKALVAQFTGYPKALGMTAGVIGAMALLPGMPVLPFLTLAGGVGFLAFRATRRRDAASRLEESAEAVEHHLAGTRPGLLDGKSLPQPMQAARHEVVHQIVAAGNLVEDLVDERRE